jgi:hypothetical protein
MDIPCRICWSSYDQHDNAPRILRNCGHTMCTSCIQSSLRVLRETFPGFNNLSLKCPFDKVEQIIDEKMTPESFPKNFEILELIIEGPQRKLSQTNLPVSLSSQKNKIPPNPLLSAQNNTHEVIQPSFIKPQVNENGKQQANEISQTTTIIKTDLLPNVPQISQNRDTIIPSTVPLRPVTNNSSTQILQNSNGFPANHSWIREYPQTVVSNGIPNTLILHNGNDRRLPTYQNSVIPPIIDNRGGGSQSLTNSTLYNRIENQSGQNAYIPISNVNSGQIITNTKQDNIVTNNQLKAPNIDHQMSILPNVIQPKPMNSNGNSNFQSTNTDFKNGELFNRRQTAPLTLKHTVSNPAPSQRFTIPSNMPQKSESFNRNTFGREINFERIDSMAPLDYDYVAQFKGNSPSIKHPALQGPSYAQNTGVGGSELRLVTFNSMTQPTQIENGRMIATEQGHQSNSLNTFSDKYSFKREDPNISNELFLAQKFNSGHQTNHITNSNIPIRNSQEFVSKAGQIGLLKSDSVIGNQSHRQDPLSSRTPLRMDGASNLPLGFPQLSKFSSERKFPNSYTEEGKNRPNLSFARHNSTVTQEQSSRKIISHRDINLNHY